MGGARFKVTTRDRGRKRFDKTIAELKKEPGVKVGVQASEAAKVHPQRDKSAEPETVLDVAIWNEFGIGVPERSFIRAWFDEARSANNALAMKQLKRVLKGQLTPKDALSQMGAVFVGQIQKRIAARIDPPNAPATIAAKGSSVPLIDEGVLRQSITWLLGRR